MTTFTIYFLYIVAAILGWVIFYYVVKAAVRNGIKEAQGHEKVQTNAEARGHEGASTNAEQKLQQRYNNGEITFETYQSEWNKLVRN